MMQLKIKSIFPSVKEPLTIAFFWQQHALYGICRSALVNH